MAPPNRRERERQKAKMVDSRKYLDDHGSEWKPTSFTVPEGMETFRFTDQGLYMIDVVPYVVQRHKGESGGNPFVDEDDVGAMSYERTYYVHGGVGTEEKSYVCLHKEYRENCPGCEYVQELLSNPTIDRKKVVNPRRPKERQLFLFYDRTSKESRKKGLQLYECAHYMSFGELLKTTLEACRLADPESPSLNFADPEDGMSLAITVKKASFSSDSGRGGTYNKPVNIQFVPRDRALPVEILEAAPCLDDIPARISYDKFYKLMHQSAAKKGDEGDGHPQTRTATRSKVAQPLKDPDDDDDDDDDIDDDVQAKPAAKPPTDRNGKKIATAADFSIEKGDEVEYNGDVCEVIHVSGDGTSLRLKGPDGKTIMGVDPEDVNKVDDEPDEEDEKPSPKKGGKKPVAKDEDDGDEDGDEDEDEEGEDQDDDEAPTAKKLAGKGKPPVSRRR